MKQIQLLVFTAVLIAFSACKKSGQDEQAPSTNVKPKTPVISQLCQTWTLKETYEDKVQKTVNGTDLYRFTEQGAFLYQYMGQWENVGTFDFPSNDSSSISMVFMGTSTPTTMYIKTLDDKNFSTEFTYGNKTYLYKYSR